MSTPRKHFQENSKFTEMQPKMLRCTRRDGNFSLQTLLKSRAGITSRFPKDAIDCAHVSTAPKSPKKMMESLSTIYELSNEHMAQAGRPTPGRCT